MPLAQNVVNQIQEYFDDSRQAHAARLRAEPNGGGLQVLVDTLKANGYSAEFVEHLDVFYSFDPQRQFPSRTGLHIPNQPIRAVLVSDNGMDVAAVNSDSTIIEALCLPEVFPTRLARLREEWEKCGEGLASEADIKADSLSRGLRVSLASFDGSPGDGGCKSSTCPGTSVVGR